MVVKAAWNDNSAKSKLMRQRPMAILIFGILNIGYALLNLAGPLVSKLMSSIKLPANSPVVAMKSDPAYVAWTNFNMGFSVVLGLALLSFGIGLLLSKNWARLGSIIYAVIAIVYVPIGEPGHVAFHETDDGTNARRVAEHDGGVRHDWSGGGNHHRAGLSGASPFLHDSRQCDRGVSAGAVAGTRLILCGNKSAVGGRVGPLSPVWPNLDKNLKS
jgi:hypothetical protein